MEFPRPNPDTGFGFHDSANAYWKPDDYPGYARMLRDHGATWFLLWTFDENKAPWCRALREAGIEPIVRLGPAYMPRPGIDMSVVDAYIAAGARWFVMGNEYNLFSEWDNDPEPPWKNMDRPLRHIAEWYVQMADQIREKGGWPLTPPPSLGGHWLHRDWFIRFMTALKNIAAERGRSLESLLYPGGIGLHCRSCGNPLGDGPADYDCSVREWEWFDSVVKDFVGHSLPMANTEWGDEPNWSKRKNPLFDNRQKWEWWVNRNVEQIQWCNPANPGYRYPDYLFANCFWILHSPPPWEDCSLIHNHPYLEEMGGSDMTPLWERLPGVVTWNRVEGGQPAPPPPDPLPEPDLPVVKLRVYDMHGQTQDYEWAHEKYGVRFAERCGEAWHVTQLREVSGPAGVECYVYDEAGQPAPGVQVSFHWPDGKDVKTTEPSGKVGFAYGPGSYITDPAVGGPHWLELSGPHDAVEGLGMLAGTFHDHLDLVYQWGVVEAPPAPPQPPEPGPEPEPGVDDPYTLVSRLEGAPYGFEDYRERVRLVPGVDMERVWAESLAAGRISESGAPLFGNLRTIVLHHMGGEYYGPIELVAWEVNENEDVDHATCPYHFIIEKSGKILFMVAIKYLTHHAYGANKHGIGICFEDEANEKQMEAGRFLIAALYELMGQGWGKFRLMGLMPHSMVWNGKPGHTVCPGEVWPRILWSDEWPRLEEPE